MEKPTKKHIGRNISRIREMKGMKQTTLAELLGISQQQVSMLENSEEVEDSKLVAVAEVLEVPVQALKEYSDEKVLNIITSTFNDSATLNNNNMFENFYPTYNPLDKVVELYERLLAAEKEKMAMLEKMMGK